VTDHFDGGWDNRVVLVEVAGRQWVQRSPRFPDREPQLRREAELLPWLAAQLPVPVPVPSVVSNDPFTVRYAYLPGSACSGMSAAQGAAVGSFLRALHAVDPGDALAHGALDAVAWHGQRVASLSRMADQVLPCLSAALRPVGEALLTRLSTPPSDPRLVHGDLGPEHIRGSGDLVTAVIDWGDAGLGDPAVDLAWTAFGAAAPFAEACLAAYGATPPLVARGRDFHLIGPWHEVVYGLAEGGPAHVDSGLEELVKRLEAAVDY
jgi:aminoglycoside phosphotransferase (APT) family kinase protein